MDFIIMTSFGTVYVYINNDCSFNFVYKVRIVQYDIINIVLKATYLLHCLRAAIKQIEESALDLSLDKKAGGSGSGWFGLIRIRISKAWT